ncbi:MAG: acyl-CoA desaturase [Cyclobacteriaceae bacterium]|nr:acyl-CoA desaturase [Cyclobacteriaceae bacterium]
MKLSPITFSRTKLDFSSALNSRVNEYFKSNNINRTGNSEMVLKTIVMFLLYFVPYVLIVSGIITMPLILLRMVIIMSLGLAGIGLSVMHDANHGAYSKRKWINTFVGYSLNLVGANSFNWKMQHNVLHHTYTNVQDEDEDVVSRGILRLTPHTQWKFIYKFQHIYAWFLYGLMTLTWMFSKDFARLIKYHKNGLAKKHRANITKEWIILLATKLIYVGYIFVIPLAFTSLAWWQIAIGIVIMHYIAGFMLAIIFQPAHVIDGTEFPLPDDQRVLKNNWAVHQLLTTTNFGNKSKWFSWYVGGLNFQIEHHLFPNVCHVHYRKIASIVKNTAHEYGLPYKSATTFFEALRGHARLLKQLGLKPVTA